MKRARDEWGLWLYCNVCGHKAYESQSAPGYFLCSGDCDYIEEKETVGHPKNVKWWREEE